MKTEELLRQPKSRLLRSGKVTLSPGEETGEHIPYKREEFIVVLKGIAYLTVNGRLFELKQGDTHYISEGVKHNVKNNTNQELEYLYVVSLFEKG